MNKLYVSYGADYINMTESLMEYANVKSRLTGGEKVVIKPNLVVPKPACDGATTHTEIVEGIIRYLQDCGIADITVAEGSWVGVRSTGEAFKKCGYTALTERYGVKLLDTKNDVAVTKDYGGLKLKVCKCFYDATLIINVPVLKGHCQTKMTCCLKNLKGCIPDSEKRRYHNLGLTQPIAALNGVLKPALHIIDSICGDLNFEEGGTPIESNRIILGYDGVLCDSFAATLMGYNPEEIGYLKLAADYGLGRLYDSSIEILEFGAENRPPVNVPSGVVRRLTRYIDEKAACSACYANLIFALNRLSGVQKVKTIKIGRGWRGETVKGIGVGDCVKGCECYISGCPPTALEILNFLRNQIN